MSSDEYFDDELDSAFLKEVDAIEAAHTQSSKPQGIQRGSTVPSQQFHTRPSLRPPSHANKLQSTVIEIGSSDDFDSFQIHDDDLQIIDNICNQALGNKSTTIPGPSRSELTRTTSKATIQTTLFGGVATQPAHTHNAKSSRIRQPSMQRNDSTASHTVNRHTKITKQWDHTAFAKTGWKKPKGKQRDLGDNGEEEEEEEEDAPV